MIFCWKCKLTLNREKISKPAFLSWNDAKNHWFTGPSWQLIIDSKVMLGYMDIVHLILPEWISRYKIHFQQLILVLITLLEPKTKRKSNQSIYWNRKSSKQGFWSISTGGIISRNNYQNVPMTGIQIKAKHCDININNWWNRG